MERHNKSKIIDSYYYELTDSNHVLFRAKNIGVKMDNKNYSFVDSRVENDSIK